MDSCDDGSCKTVSAGTTKSLVLDVDGNCNAAGDAYSLCLHVSATEGSCTAYDLEVFFDAGYCEE